MWERVPSMCGVVGRDPYRECALQFRWWWWWWWHFALVLKPAAAHGVHLHPCAGLYLGDWCQLKVEAVNNSPAKSPSCAQRHPDDQGEDVVAKDHVIHNGAVGPGQHPPDDKDPHHHQPARETSLLLQSESIEHDATGNEKENALEDAEKGWHHEEVSDVVVAHVDKIKGEKVNSCVAGSRFCLLQAVGIKTCLNRNLVRDG